MNDYRRINTEQLKHKIKVLREIETHDSLLVGAMLKTLLFCLEPEDQPEACKHERLDHLCSDCEKYVDKSYCLNGGCHCEVGVKPSQILMPCGNNCINSTPPKDQPEECKETSYSINLNSLLGDESKKITVFEYTEINRQLIRAILALILAGEIKLNQIGYNKLGDDLKELFIKDD